MYDGAVSSDLPSLNAHEARVLGVPVEKSLTPPEHYPLSLNAATAGANQKSNRNPVVDYLEAEVHVALQGLVLKHLAGRVSGAGSRTEKYKHNAAEALSLEQAGVAVLAELMMRCAQTAGELRQRANRMSPLPSLDDLRAVLDGLLERGIVRRLPPAPGSRAERFEQTLTPSDEPAAAAEDRPTPDTSGASTPTPRAPAGGLEQRVASLEDEVASLRRELADLQDQLGVGGGGSDTA